ncbi:MAG: SMI1/KNR4 family protein [Paludibacteraceae bacterium]|nr:SMI1/KNR4 family protein [Paludibacteraceae bacterium]
MTTIEKIFNQYIELIEKKIPQIKLLLSGGANDVDMEELQNFIDKKLPEDFVNLYHIHNGEVSGDGSKIMAGLRFLSLKEIQSYYNSIVALDKKFAPVKTLSISDKSSAKNKWVPFASDEDECFFAVDLTPAKGNGKIGQIIALEDGLDGQCSYLVAESLTEFVEKLIGWWKDGSIVARSEGDYMFISEKNGHFFNSMPGYAIMSSDGKPALTIELKDEYWIEYFGGNSITTAQLSKMEGSMWADCTDVSCEPIAYWGNLKEAGFSYNTVRDFHYLGLNKTVKRLNLAGATLLDGDLSVLKDCVNLRDVSICNMKDLTGLESLVDLPNLEMFTFSGDLTEQVQSCIVSLPHLKSLTLRKLTNSGMDFSFISKCKNLQRLEITFKDETRFENLEFLLKIKNLSVFKTNTFALDEQALTPVLQLKKLKEFHYPVKELEMYRQNTNLKTMGILGHDGIDVNMFAETNCKEVNVICDDTFKNSNSYKILWNDLMKQGKISSVLYTKLLTKNNGRIL